MDSIMSDAEAKHFHGYLDYLRVVGGRRPPWKAIVTHI